MSPFFRIVLAILGIGALVGNVLAGWLHDRLGGHGMFAAAAALELVPALLVLRLYPPATAFVAADPR